MTFNHINNKLIINAMALEDLYIYLNYTPKKEYSVNLWFSYLFMALMGLVAPYQNYHFLFVIGDLSILLHK